MGLVGPTVFLLPSGTLWWSEGGGFLWTYLNWALGLRAAGCQVFWLERVLDQAEDEIEERVQRLEQCLAPFGFAEAIALCDRNGIPLRGDPDLADGDLLLNFTYAAATDLVRRGRRAALVDIDPGLLQTWVACGALEIAPHDVYFTIGETVGRPDAGFPSCGIDWHHTPPVVHLSSWPISPAPAAAAYTTVSSWWTSDTVDVNGAALQNDKRAGFRAFETLPSLTDVPLELALCFGADQELEQERLSKAGWRVRHSLEVAASPLEYREYIRSSRGEFSAAKPSCNFFANAWISDRTICYLASGKPAVVQHTGASRLLPEDAGLFRVRTATEAAAALAAIEADYERHARLARELAEKNFDAEKAVGDVLDRALG